MSHAPRSQLRPDFVFQRRIMGSHGGPFYDLIGCSAVWPRLLLFIVRLELMIGFGLDAGTRKHSCCSALQPHSQPELIKGAKSRRPFLSAYYSCKALLNLNLWILVRCSVGRRVFSSHNRIMHQVIFNSHIFPAWTFLLLLMEMFSVLNVTCGGKVSQNEHRLHAGQEMWKYWYLPYLWFI